MRRAAYIFAALLFFFCAREGFASKADSANTKIAVTSKKTKKITKKKTSSKKKKPAKPAPPKKIISVAPPSNLKPTFTGAPGTVKNYFFPNKKGALWKLRTIRVWLVKDSVLQRDTLFGESRVTDTARYSLQGLPLMVTADSSYTPDGKGTSGESVYYVDDSIAMTVFNNSISNGENRIFLMSPVKLRTGWPERYDDTTITMIAGFGDSVMTPLGRFDRVMVTLTQQDYSDMRKYYAPGHGIIKSIFRTLGPSGKGIIIVTTEMIGFALPEEKKK